MKKENRILKWGLLSLSILVLFLLDVLFGGALPFKEVWALEGDVLLELLLDIRLPRVLTSILVGAGLAVAGLNMQVLFRNPLAGPSILGVNAGSTLMVALVLLGFSGSAVSASFAFDITGNLVLLASIIGALLVLFLIAIFSYWISNNISLLITGLLFSYFSIAIVSLLQFFAQPDQLRTFIFWTFGTVDGLNYAQIILLAMVVLIPSFILWTQGPRLNVFLLGNAYAKNLGLNLEKIKWMLIIITAVITGIVTAFCGPIAFIGLAVPHLARMVMKTNDNRVLIISSFLIGMGLMLLSDILSHSSTSVVFPINAITAILGTPIILFYIVKTRHKTLSV